VYPAPFEYFAPASIEEALDLLHRYGDDAKVLAGGQSLIPLMKLRFASPRYLVDVNRIASLAGCSSDADRIVLGALCRHAEVAAAPDVLERLPLMIDAASLTADVQVRNRGTIGGSLAHADPAGDWPAALLALDARVHIAGRSGRRSLPLRDFIVDAHTTELAHDEILAAVEVPFPRQPCGGAYCKFERRTGDFAVASVAVQVELADDEARCRRVSISLGALGATALRAHEAEQLLVGQAATPALLDQAADAVRSAAQPFADARGSVEYKRHLAGVLFRRTFAAALDRACGRDVGTLHV
jgi:carbon-monoxide dehydrogenase medium subunit